MEQISPELFTYELYEPCFWQRLGFSFDVSQSQVTQKVLDNAVGWCDSARLQVRPRHGMIAVMCIDDDGEKFWFHQNREFYHTDSLN